MIELSNIIGFIVSTIILVLVEWWVYRDIKRALRVLPMAMFFSGILSLVWALV